MASSLHQTAKPRELAIGTLIEERIATVEGGYKIKRYDIERLLGKGSSGSAYQVIEVETQKPMAVKIVSKASLKKPQTQRKLLSEIQIHKTLQHPNIVQFYHVFEDKDYVYILLELCPNLTLKHQLKEKGKYTELEVQHYMYQIIDGLKFLHSREIIHRDLKLGNLFLDREMNVKIGDFGLSARLDPSMERRKTLCGTPNFVAPEILNQEGYSFEADIWSLGVVCYTMLFGHMPFETTDVKEIYKKIQKGEYVFPEDVDISEPAKDFVSKILVLDPLKRPSFKEMLEHPFLSTKGKIPKSMPVHIPNTASSTAFLENLARDRRATELPKSPSEFFTEKPKKKSLTSIATLKLSFLKKGRKLTKNKLEDSKDLVKSAENPQLTHKRTMTIDTKDNLKSALPVIAEGSMKRAKLEQERLEILEDVCITNWIEHSKYGVGYILSNSWIGVLFNDSSKMMLSPQQTTFEYIETTYLEKKPIHTTHTFAEYPKELNKKVSILQRFKDLFASNSNSDTDCETRRSYNNNTQLLVRKKTIAPAAVFLKKWIKTKQAVLFKLSSKVWQVTFRDKTVLIINPKKQIVIYNDTEATKSTFQMDSVLGCGNPEVIKRLKYAQEVLKKAKKIEKASH